MRTNRIGVYLHWSLPRLYRTGLSSTTDIPPNTSSAAESARRAASGLPPLPSTNADAHAPQFRRTPNRFLVTRRITPASILPATAARFVPEFTAWIIDSDLLSNIQTLPRSTDLEVDVSPFVDGTLDTLDSQAELFIGSCLPAASWRERGNTSAAPRVAVSVLNSANQLFADYVPHCGNVFSMLDRFEYVDTAGVRGTLTDATASYSVVGWHSSDRIVDDPFWIDPSNPVSRATRLAALNMVLPASSPAPPQWLSANTSARTLVHGSLYDVLFSSHTALPTPADDVAALLHTASPVALGTTPTDALLAFVDAHATDPSADKALADLTRIQQLLLRGEETADGQYEAADMLSAHNFAPCPDSGSTWHLSGSSSSSSSSSTATTPTPAVQQALATLNATQAALDTAKRALHVLQYQLWSVWWTYLTTPHPDAATRAGIKDMVGGISGAIDKLQKQVDTWAGTITGLAQGMNVEKGASERFWTLRDPTVLLGGLRSAWPGDWVEKLRSRLDSMLVLGGGGGGTSGWQVDSFAATILGVLPTDMQGAFRGLLREFAQLRPRGNIADDTAAAATGGVLPLYYGPEQGAVQRRDVWGGKQPWFPLFIEWEVEYTHVPFENWTFAPVAVAGAPPRMRWGVKAESVLQGLQGKDSQRASGRVLVLPQAGFSLGVSIEQLFASTAPGVLEAVGYAGKADQDELLREVAGLPFLSAPLTGLTEHLTTRLRGTHVKASRRVPGSGLVALPTAQIEAIGIGGKQILQMGTEAATVPYGFHVDAAEGRPALFKPAMHGQMRFTRLDVIDRWGQCVSAIDPRPAVETPPLWPIVSEYYRPQMDSAAAAKTVGVLSEPKGHCRYAQVPPNVNQDARLNAHFLVRDGTGVASPWRPATEWESPIWGWLVVNYAEEGLQFFLPNGTFYREVRLGGVFGATAQPPWRPFPPPDNLTATSATPQLDRLLARLKDDAVYLRAFVSTINAATTSVAHPPNEYADYMASITGRPLALANIGYSLELAAPPLTNQSRRSTTSPTKQLLDYEFKLKLGDIDRAYDGLVGYFPGAANPTVDTGPPAGTECDYSQMYTYFPRAANDPGASVTNNIGPEDYLPVKPYYINPAPGTDPALLRRQHSAGLKVVGCVLDPFTAVHLYTGIVPIMGLVLPQWSVQSALKAMTAFFAVGPVVVTTRDVVERAQRMGVVGGGKDYVGALPEMGTAVEGTGMPVPAAAAVGEWVWLQPVRVPGAVTGGAAGTAGTGAAGRGAGTTAVAGGGTTGDEVMPAGTAPAGDGGQTMFSPLGIEKVDAKARFEDGPYTAVEGYLQLKKALIF